MGTDLTDRAHLIADGDMSVVEVRPFLTGQVALYSARNPERDGANEDAAALIQVDETRGVLVVADGVGGHPSGEHAARHAIEALRSAISGQDPEERELRYAILNGFEAANAAVRELGVGAATTLVVAEIDGGSLRPYHVGDSTILVTGQRGKRKLETISHSPTGYAVESGLMNETEAIEHEERHVVSNLVGDREMRIEVGAHASLAPHDTVLLASDGLIDNLLTEEIVERVRKGPLRKACNGLAIECRRHVLGESTPSKPDDVTFIAFRLGRAAAT